MTITQRASKANADKLNKAYIKEIETLVEVEVSEEKTNQLKSLKSIRGRTELQKQKLSNQTKIDLEVRNELLQQEIIKLKSTTDRKFTQFKTINSLLSEEDMVQKLKWQARTIRNISKQKDYWKRLAEPSLKTTLKKIWKRCVELKDDDSNGILYLVELLTSTNALSIGTMPYDLIASQLKYFGLDPDKRYIERASNHYSEEIRAYFKLFFASHGKSAYNDLSPILRIPHIRTQQKTIAQTHMSVGIDKQRIEDISNDFKKRKEKAPILYGVISVDATDVQYPMIQRIKGKISGTIDFGGMEKAVEWDEKPISELENDFTAFEFSLGIYIDDITNGYLNANDILKYLKTSLSEMNHQLEKLYESRIKVKKTIVVFEDDTKVHKNMLNRNEERKVSVEQMTKIIDETIMSMVAVQELLGKFAGIVDVESGQRDIFTVDEIENHIMDNIHSHLTMNVKKTYLEILERFRASYVTIHLSTLKRATKLLLFTFNDTLNLKSQPICFSFIQSETYKSVQTFLQTLTLLFEAEGVPMAHVCADGGSHGIIVKGLFGGKIFLPDILNDIKSETKILSKMLYSPADFHILMAPGLLQSKVNLFFGQGSGNKFGIKRDSNLKHWTQEMVVPPNIKDII
jgi:hypothetical protein